MGVFSDALASTSKPKLGPSRTRLEELRDTLDPDDFAALQAAIADPQVTASHLHTALKKAGHPVAESTIRRWKNGG